MTKRQTGLVVGKDFYPPSGAQPLDWCFLTVDLSDEQRISVRIRREHVSHTDVGDVIVFSRPRKAEHAVSRLSRVASDPSLLPPVDGHQV